MGDTALNAAFLALAIIDILLGIGALILKDSRPKLILGVFCLLLLIPVILLGANSLFPPYTYTATPAPDQNLQVVLLRGSCRTEYVVNANEPVIIYYGGWFVKGMDLAQQWTTALDVSISVDGTQISGEQHSPVDELPFNCTEDKDDIYWLYYTTTFSKFSPGVHEISVTFNILREFHDGLGENYVPGKLGDFTFKVTAK